MSEEKKTPRAMGQLSADDPRASSQSRRRVKQAVPVGLERVLFVASRDAEFRAELLRDAERAVAARGLSLRASEWAMLRAVPAERLLSTVKGIDTSPENVARRGFMRAVAAGAMAVAAAGCGSDSETLDGGSVDVPPPVRGIQPDDASVETVEPVAGVRPDSVSPDTPDAAEAGPGDAACDTVDIGEMGPAATGIRPDAAE